MQSVHSGYGVCAIRASSSGSLPCGESGGLAAKIISGIFYISFKSEVNRKFDTILPASESGRILFLSVMLMEKLPSTGVPLSSLLKFEGIPFLFFRMSAYLQEFAIDADSGRV